MTVASPCAIFAHSLAASLSLCLLTRSPVLPLAQSPSSALSFATSHLCPFLPILAQSMSARQPMLENFAPHSAFDSSPASALCLLLRLHPSLSVVCGRRSFISSDLSSNPPSSIAFLVAVLFVVVKSFGILLSKLFCNYFHLPRHAIPLLLDLCPLCLVLASPLSLPCLARACCPSAIFGRSN